MHTPIEAAQSGYASSFVGDCFSFGNKRGICIRLNKSVVGRTLRDAGSAHGAVATSPTDSQMGEMIFVEWIQTRPRNPPVVLAVTLLPDYAAAS
jgi:hypothetical protein